MSPRKDKQKMHQQGKRASTTPDEPQSSKCLVTIPIIYQESAFHCGYQCVADRLLDEHLQVMALRQGCPKCVLLELRIQQQDNRIADLAPENAQQDKRIAEQEKHIAEQDRRNTIQDRLIADLRDQVNNLQQPAQRMQAIVRQIAVIKARHTIIQRTGRSIKDMTWNEYYGSLTSKERDASGVESSAVWRKLASGKKVGNEAAHVASKGEVAEAICAAQESKESWYSIFHLAYGEDPESLAFDE